MWAICVGGGKPPAGRRGKRGAEVKEVWRTGGTEALAAGAAATGRNASAPTNYPSSPILRGAYIRDRSQANVHGKNMKMVSAALPRTAWLITLVVSLGSHSLPGWCAPRPFRASRLSIRPRILPFHPPLAHRGAPQEAWRAEGNVRRKGMGNPDPRVSLMRTLK